MTYTMADIKYCLCTCIFVSVGFIPNIKAGDVSQVFINGNVTPIKDSAVQINCNVTDYSDNVALFESSTANGEKKSLNSCNSRICISASKNGADYTVQGHIITISIASLNRTRDQKYWWCQDKNIFLQIYTVPKTLQFENSPSQDQDLVQNSVTFKCSTDCSYPQPLFFWFYKEDGVSQQVWLSSGSITNKTNGCTDSEKIYTSILSLGRYTTFPQNLNKIVKFLCGISTFPGMSQPLYSLPSVKVQFAVLASTPTLTNQTTENLVLLENNSTILECITSATRPVSEVTWKIGTLSITTVNNTNISHTSGLVSVRSIVTFTPNRTDNNKTIYCQTYIPTQINKPPSTSQTIVVYWAPSTPSIPLTEFPFLEGQTGKNLYCFSTEYGNPAAIAVWISAFGTKDSGDSRKLNLPKLTLHHDGLSVSCQLTNLFTQLKGSLVKSKVINVNVEYTPIVQIMERGTVVQSILRNEGQNLTVFCNATGNPRPTVKWNDQIPDSEYLQFSDIDRTEHGSYTCEAKAISLKYQNHNFVNEKTLQVDVNYAPEVIVEVNEAEPIENSSLLISCTPSGRPTEYSSISMVQKFGETTIPNTHVPVNGILKIPNIQLQDSGTYTCTANNGIPDRNQQLDQTGERKVLVRVSPKVLLDSFTFAGTPGKSVNITVPFFSYPDILHVKFKFQNGSEINNSGKHKVYYERQKVRAEFYWTEIELDGYIAVLQIKYIEMSDFTYYIFELDNNIGPLSQWSLHHVSESIPSTPTNFKILVDLTIPTFVWTKNDNGGFHQRFVIQVSVAGTGVWTNQTDISEEDKQYQINETFYIAKINDMIPGIYIARIFSYNIHGVSEYVYLGTAFEISIKHDSGKHEKKSSTVAIAAGISSTLVILIAVVIVVIVFVRRRMKGLKANNKSNISGQSPNMHYEELPGERERDIRLSSMYDSLEARNTDLSTEESIADTEIRAEKATDKAYENLKIDDKK